MIRCDECNEENMDGLEYCDSCGAKLETPAADGVEAAPAVTDEAAATEAGDSVEHAPAEAVQEVAEAAGSKVAEEAPAGDDVPAEAVQEVAEAAGSEVAEEAPAEEDVPTEAVQDVAEAAGSEVAEEPVPVGAPVQAAKLTVMRGGTVGKEFPLQAGDNLIGRWDPDSGSFPEVDLESDDTEARISRKHALIKFGATITIEDIGSLNGTFVNRGQRLEPGSPATLKDGDEIIIGKTFFKVAVA